MKKKPRLQIMVLATVGLLATAACADSVPEEAADTGGDLPTTQVAPTEGTGATDPTETTEAGTTDVGSDPAELAAQLQSELATLGEEIQASEAAEELGTAWTEVEAEISSAIATIDAEGNIETGDIESQLDQFQSTLDSMGEDIGSDVREAWTNLRSTLEELMS